VTDNTDNLKYLEKLLKKDYQEILVGIGNSYKGNKIVTEQKEKLTSLLLGYEEKLVEIDTGKEIQGVHPLYAGRRCGEKWVLKRFSLEKKPKKL
jgi:hypothetical protein